MKNKKHICKSNYQKSQERESDFRQMSADSSYLYHGTDEVSAMKILREGFRPRMESVGNWETFPSNPKCVYLTNCYAAYFALCAMLKTGGRMGIVEIQTTVELLDKCVPDEDYLEHSTRNGHPYTTEETIERTKLCQVKMLGMKGQWKESLSGLGNLCHVGPIDSKHIRRVALLDGELWGWLLSHSMGPGFRVAFSQHSKNLPKQKALTRWIFGEHVPYREILGDHRPSNVERRLLSERRGIEIITNTQDLLEAA